MFAGLFLRLIKSSVSSFDRLLKEQLDLLDQSALRPSFSNSESKVYLRAVDLNEFQSFTVLITGCLNINTISGCTLTFLAGENSLSRQSDSEIVKGDYSQNLNIGMTSFDIDRDEELIEFIKKNTLTGLTMETRTGKIVKEALRFDFPTVYMEDLLDSLEYKDPSDEELIFEEVMADELEVESEEE